MVRLLIVVIFLIGFVIFTVIKLVLTGTKEAYQAVFDPTAKDEKIEALISNCMLRVSHVMHEKYTQQPGELSMAILKLTPIVQSIILEKGYQANAAIAQAIVCDAIVLFGHATQEEVDRAKS